MPRGSVARMLLSVPLTLANDQPHKLQRALKVCRVRRLPHPHGRIWSSTPRSINERGPCWIKSRLCPRRTSPLRAGTPVDEVVQHATVAQDDEALIEAITVTFRLVKNLLTPVANRVANLPTERVDRNRIDERCGTWSGQRDSALADNAPDDERVAVIGPRQRLASVIEIPERLAALPTITESRHRKIRSL